MPIIKMPSAKSYKELETRYDKVGDVINRHRLLEIKRFIHCSDNMTALQPLNDPLYKKELL